MSLPDSHTLKPGSIPAYFEAMLGAEAPKRFTARFLESLEFTSSTDRLFIGILRDLGFVDQESAPTDRERMRFVSIRNTKQLIFCAISNHVGPRLPRHSSAASLRIRRTTYNDRVIFFALTPSLRRLSMKDCNFSTYPRERQIPDERIAQ
jgi:Family of unknown function (DUF5343)